MKIKILAVGKIKEPWFKEAAAEYVKRLGRFCRVEWEEIDEADVKDKSAANVQAALRREGKSLSSKQEGFVVALDIDGNQLSSAEFAEFLEKRAQDCPVFTFVIGGSNGLDESLKRNADFRLSFGKITLPHNLARVVLCEQIYRAFMINSNSTYHK